MISGRHLLLVGLLASAGLVSVHDSQELVRLGYETAQTEKSLRQTARQRDLAQTRWDALVEKKRVIAKAVELKLDVAPSSPLDPYATPALEEKQRQSAQRLDRPAANAPRGNAPRPPRADPRAGR